MTRDSSSSRSMQTTAGDRRQHFPDLSSLLRGAGRDASPQPAAGHAGTPLPGTEPNQRSLMDFQGVGFVGCFLGQQRLCLRLLHRPHG